MESSPRKFQRLFAPGQIGGLTLKNRVVTAAAGTNLAGEDGSVTQQTRDYYARIARGGAALVIVGTASVDPAGRLLSRLLNIDDDRYIPGLSGLVQCIHQHGAKAAIQINHGGRSASSSVTGVQPVAPSAIAEPYWETPRELTRAEIGDVIARHAQAAERAKRSGFDGVEIHAAHSYLVAEFLSRNSNRRNDDYGGSLENRARILVEIIRATREAVGQSYPVWCRINGAELDMKDGLTLAEAQAVARMCQDNGVDAIHVSAWGNPLTTDSVVPDLPGLFLPLARGIKQVVSIPVIAVGKITPELGEQAIKKGDADFIAMYRALVADPDLPLKVQTGRLADVRPCTGCLECISLIAKDEIMRCRVNASFGRDEEQDMKPAERSKKVVVVGSGPAGMEAARVAALRGHKVVLYEKERKLGGLLPFAALIKGTEVEDLPALVRYYQIQLAKLGVEVRLGREVTPALIEETMPDVVVLATGGKLAVPEIPGINGRNVVSSQDLHRRAKFFLRFMPPELLRWLTRFWMPVGKRVIIMGGLMHGCEVAELLVKRGRKVTIVEASNHLGTGIPAVKRLRFFHWLEQKGVNILTGVKYEEVTSRGLTIITSKGDRQTIDADTILVAMPPDPHAELFGQLEGKVGQIYQIGDCVQPRLIIDAIDDGYRVGCAI